MHHNWAHLIHMAGHAIIHIVNHGKKHGHNATDTAVAEQQRLAREQAERERQAALAYQARLRAIAREEDRPKRNLRNFLRFAGCVALCIMTVISIANQDILWGTITLFVTVGGISSARKTWEK